MGMYNKDLVRDFRLRLSDRDMNFLQQLAKERNESVSALVRYIIGEYRRGYDALQFLSTNYERVVDVHGDTETNFND